MDVPLSTSEGQSKMKRFLFRLVLLVLSICFTAILAECALRWMVAADQKKGGNLQERLERSKHSGLDDLKGNVSLRGLIQPSIHKDIVYEAKPGLQGRFRDRKVHINSASMRDREFTVDKPGNTFRIVGLGDSVMFGWGVGQDETFLRKLARKLNALTAPHPTYETLNFALPGYNTTMEVATFEHKVLAYDPDLVIIQFVNNDWGVPHFMFKPKDPKAWNRSFLWDLLRTRLGWISQDHESGLVGSRLHGLEDEERSDVLGVYRHMTGSSGYRNAMNHLAELTQPRDIPVIILRGSYWEKLSRPDIG